MAVLYFLAAETSTAGTPAPVPPKRVHFKGARIMARIFLSYRRDDSGGYVGRQQFPLSLQAQSSLGQLPWPFVNIDAKIAPDLNAVIFS
jgi:hypothetical protein